MLTTCDDVLNWITIRKGAGYFRGYKNSVELTATLGRPSIAPILDKYQDFEFQSIKKLALALIDKDFDLLTFQKVIEIGQHYGLPTRFVDLTTNPYVAIFFGIGAKNDGHFNLLFVNKDNSLLISEFEKSLTMAKELMNSKLGELKKLYLGQMKYLAADTPMNKDYIESSIFQSRWQQFFDIQAEFVLVPYDTTGMNQRRLIQQGLFIAMKNYTEQLSEDLYDSVEVLLPESELSQLVTVLTEKKMTSDHLLDQWVDQANVVDIIRNILKCYYS